MALSSETIAAIRAEREALAAQVAALDAALLALDAVFSDAPMQPHKARKVKATKAAKVKAIAPTADASDAADRRDILLHVIQKAPLGLTVAELRKKTPEMDGPDRSNSLQSLKATNLIKRVGNAWQAV